MYTQHISIHIHCCLFMCLFNSNGDSRSGVPGVLQQRWDLDPNAQLGMKHSNDKLGLDQKAMGKFMAVDFWHCKIQQTVAKKKVQPASSPLDATSSFWIFSSRSVQ